MKMIRVISVCLLLCGVLTYSYAQVDDGTWTWQNPVPLGNSLNHVFAWDADSVIIVGGGGVIARTFDGGENWDIQNYGGFNFMGIRNSIKSVYFVDNSNGWAVGNLNTIIHTSDGGSTWEVQHEEPEWEAMSDVFFTDNEHGWAVGGYADGVDYYFHTSDSGNNWNKEIIDDVINSVYFIDDSTGWMVGKDTYEKRGIVYKTSDGGAHWETVSVGSMLDQTELKSVYFIDAHTGWAVGTEGLYAPPESYSDGVIYETTDGGAHWTLKYRGNVDRFHEVDFVSNMVGWMLSDNGILMTSDGGESWNLLVSNSFVGAQINAINLIDAHTGWLVSGCGDILKTIDGGDNWRSFTSTITRSDLREVQFINETTGLAVGKENGVIIRTTDGGENWSVQYSNVNSYIRCVAFVGTEAWAVGNDALLLHSDDGGVTWETQSGPMDANYRRVYFLNEDTGWIVTSERYILKTTDGGATWDAIDVDANGELSFEVLWDIQFIDENHGWLGAWEGIAETTDGGESWSEIYIGDGEFTDMFWVDLNTGYFCDMLGRIYKTSDGGDTWEKTSVPASLFSLMSIHFLDENVGWACGHWGTILKTTDGFVWELANSPTQRQLERITAVNDTTAWVVGYNGIIMKYSSSHVSIDHDVRPSENYLLSTNSPNPFFTSTEIKYYVPQDSDVTIEIYDIRGRRLKTFSRGKQDRGYHSFILNADQFASGIYLYKIHAGEYSEVKRMLLLKK